MEQWVKAAQLGDEHAWALLYQQHYPRLYSLALSICGNTFEAKDALQDTFITAYLKLGTLKEASAFGSWTRKILIHHCHRITGNHARKNIVGESALHEKYCDDEVNRTFDWLHSQNRLHGILANLPEFLHSTLLLRFFSNFCSYEEIAAILCVPVGTVRSRLNQAKIRLAEAWRRHELLCAEMFKQDSEWNEFYYSTFAALHEHDNYKDRFIDHLQTDMEIVFSKRERNWGSWLIDKEINDDRKFGSWFYPINVFSSGSTSVVEVKHFNPPEHPERCPQSSVFVLFRKNGKVSRMNFHHAHE